MFQQLARRVTLCTTGIVLQQPTEHPVENPNIPIVTLPADPVRPYYMTIGLPNPIKIDVGRQLFVDDFLIANTSKLTRTAPIRWIIRKTLYLKPFRRQAGKRAEAKISPSERPITTASGGILPSTFGRCGTWAAMALRPAGRRHGVARFATGRPDMGAIQDEPVPRRSRDPYIFRWHELDAPDPHL